MIFWPWVLVAFGFGVFAAWGLAAFLASLPLPPPRCTAILKSGHGCKKELGHPGPHRTIIHNGGYYDQEYVWEDPKAGLHTTGFFYR